MKPSIHIFWVLILISCFNQLKATEKILYFHSDITVLENGGLDIVETIKVNAEGNQIKRGIFRVLPTTYKAKFGLNFEVSYDFISVTRDGNSDDFHTEETNSEVKLYEGNSSVFLNNGEYVYKIHYVTDNQLSFYEDFDELYWNVNGNYWDFGIDSLSAIVKVPNGAHVIQYHAYMGSYGKSESNYSARIINDSTAVFFNAAAYLPAGEGVTVAVAFNKGIVAEPNYIEKLLKDNLGYLIGLMGLLIMSLYFLFSWSSVGIDPPKGVVYPRFEAPSGLSPAATRFIYKMGFDKKAFTASVLDLAVKGHLKIEGDKSNDYKLRLITKEGNVLAPGEKAILDKLFRGNLSVLKLEQKNHTEIQSAIDGLRSNLKQELEKDHFKINKGFLIMGIVIALPFLAGMFLMTKQSMELFSTVWLTIWSIGCVFLLKQAFASFKTKQYFGGLGLLLFSLPFIAAWVFAFAMFGGATSITAIIILLLYIIVILLFNYLLKAPTVMGRKVMDEIEGFQMYLKTAEQHRMELIKSTEENIKLFEKFLPYAIALNCETEWTKKFESVINDALKKGTYEPTWYGGHYGNFNAGNLGGSLASSLHNTITTSSRAPQSPSSGGGGGYSGGGGFSGGGGGGGGGGGW